MVLDNTRLTGRYDFVLRRREQAKVGNDQDPVLAYDLDALGLTLKAAKAPTMVLVVDHIEWPRVS